MNPAILIFDLLALSAIAWWRYRGQPKDIGTLFWPALLFKLLAGVGVGLLYFYHYGHGDTIMFWRDSVVISNNLRADPMTTLATMYNDGAGQVQGLVYNKDRAVFFVKNLGVIAFFCDNNYWMMSIVLSFISFLAAWFVFRVTIECFPASRFAAAVAFLFFPPVVFWSSGLIKESLGLASVFFLAGIFLRLVFQKKIDLMQLIFALIFIWIGWRLKYYWIAIFLLISVSVLVVSLLRDKNYRLPRYALPLWIVLLMLLSVAGTSLHPNFSSDRFFPMIVENNEAFMKLSDPRNTVEFTDLKADFFSMLWNSPKALLTGFFRPFIWEAFNTLSFIASVGNLFLLAVVVTAIPGLKKLSSTQNSLLVIGAVTYCMMLATFLALSTPNFGTLDRYKTGFSPFLLFVALYRNPVLEKLLPRRDQYSSEI